MHELADMPPAQLHAYSPASGLDETKTAIADNLNRRFGTDYAAKNFYPHHRCGFVPLLRIKALL